VIAYAWPWEVTIHCLGKMEVRVHGELVQIQKKPLDLLKSIIALGSVEVKCERIVDLHWPEAEGDVGMSNLKVTLHRLRNLLGEGSILLKDGRLSLNNRKVWLDAWAFERLCLKSAVEWCKEGVLGVTQKLTHRAMSLYEGSCFAEDDQEQKWCQRQREKLSRSYVAVVNFLGSRYLAAGDTTGAIATYQKGLEAEPLAESFYEGLIKACLVAGYRAQAAQVYRRYENRWSEDFGARPAKPLDQMIAETEKTVYRNECGQPGGYP
jgi:LuxR family transcriptional regulator, maltose regulon positive regulatory protein